MGRLTRREFTKVAALTSLGAMAFLTGCTRSFQKPDLRALSMAPPATEPKALVVCQDGTWNSFDGDPGDSAEITNVARLYGALSGSSRQRVYYHNGVGQFGDRIAGGDLGAGLSQRIIVAYEFLCKNYSRGDQIYLFGFSRGAFG